MSDIGMSSVKRVAALTDRFHRTISYLRLAVTDRCNLRCTYCMPAQGIVLLKHADVLAFEEMERLVRLLAPLGVSKVRLTGGEPFVRKGLLPFMQRLSRIPGVRQLHLTTNGVQTAPFIPQLQAMGVAGVNLSLDALDRDLFMRLSRRDCFDHVRRTLDGLLHSSIPLKINTVIKFGVNDSAIKDIALLARDYNIRVRFIEEMPFHGGPHEPYQCTNHRIEQRLRELFPIKPAGFQTGTARLFEVPGFKGKIGIINGGERTFCDGCNRIRITADGRLKTCLYDDGVLDLRAMLRAGASDDAIVAAIRKAVFQRFADGHEAEAAQQQDKKSMSQIGG